MPYILFLVGPTGIILVKYTEILGEQIKTYNLANNVTMNQEFVEYDFPQYWNIVILIYMMAREAGLIIPSCCLIGFASKISDPMIGGSAMSLYNGIYGEVYQLKKSGTKTEVKKRKNSTFFSILQKPPLP